MGAKASNKISKKVSWGTNDEIIERSFYNDGVHLVLEIEEKD